MNKLIVVLVMMVAGVAGAQPAGSASPEAGEPAAKPAPPPVKDAAALRQICSEAMNADPQFAKDIALTVDKQIDQKTIDAHTDANYHVQKNERHVIYAYAAMWVVAALFVVFLWRRQQGLQTEIALLRKDLESAAKEPK